MLQKVLLVWVLAWTVIAFALMGIDKAKAKRHKQRIPEKILFLSAILSGRCCSLQLWAAAWGAWWACPCSGTKRSTGLSASGCL